MRLSGLKTRKKTGPKVDKSNDKEYEEGETEENVIWLLYLV